MRIRQKALRDKMTLTRLLDFGRNIEDADHQCAEMEKITLYSHHISWVNRQSTHNKTYKQRPATPQSHQREAQSCVQQPDDRIMCITSIMVHLVTYSSMMLVKVMKLRTHQHISMYTHVTPSPHKAVLSHRYACF